MTTVHRIRSRLGRAQSSRAAGLWPIKVVPGRKSTSEYMSEKSFIKISKTQPTIVAKEAANR